jgi:hypothetical protein
MLAVREQALAVDGAFAAGVEIAPVVIAEIGTFPGVTPVYRNWPWTDGSVHRRPSQEHTIEHTQRHGIYVSS